MLRVYTKPFAETIRRLLPKLQLHGEGQPELPDSLEPLQAQTEFDLMGWTTWHEAKLLCPIRYLRGNKHLQVPESWQCVFPLAAEILSWRDMPTVPGYGALMSHQEE